MKRVLCGIMAVIMAAAVSCVPAVAEDNAVNLLKNGGFEENTAGSDDWKFSSAVNWNNEGDTTAERTDTQHNSGSYSAMVNKGTFGQRALLAAGKSYRLEAYVRADTATASPDMGFYLDNEYGYPSQNDKKKLDINASESWEKFTLEFTCSESGNYAICLLSWDDNVNVYFDDVTLVEFEPEYDGNGIENGSFSDGMNGWTAAGRGAGVTDGALTISGTNYNTRVSQTVTGVENGIYDLILYGRTSDIDGVAYAYGKTAGHTMASTAIPQTASSAEIVVPDIAVDDGQCEVGIYAKGSAVVTADNFALIKKEKASLPFFTGGEISKLTYVEDMGGKFRRADDTEADALQIMAENGFNLARIRVLNDPGKGHGNGDYYLPAGYQTKEDCLNLARRAKEKGMQIMFTFAYSDYWTDGGQQFMPHEWQEYINENNLSGEEMITYLENQVYLFTREVMQALIAQGTCPEYVSIGNEMQYGLFYGSWEGASSELYNNADNLARFLNAGARAVRELAPETKIALHTDDGGLVYSKKATFKKAVSKVDCDIIAVSYYPYYNKNVSIETVLSDFSTLINTYDKDVIIMETGYNWNSKRGDGETGQLENSGYYQDIYGEDQKGQRAFLTELYSKLKQTTGGRCIGDLYWDPVMLYKKEGEQNKIGWAVKTDEYGEWTQHNAVSNSNLFDFDGRAVKGQLAMKYNTNSTDHINIAGRVTNDSGVLPDTLVTLTADGSQYTARTDKYGDYLISIPYPENENITVSADGFDEARNEKITSNAVLFGGVDFGTTYFTNLTGSFNADGALSYSADYVTAEQNEKLYIALYNSDGMLIGCKKAKQSTFDAVTEKGTYTLKAALWQEANEPACPSSEIQIEYN